MFLFMYCKNHSPVNLREQKLFEVIVPVLPTITSATNKVGIKRKKEKNAQKISFFAVGSKEGN